MISETMFGIKANGVHSAFRDIYEFLQKKDNIEIVVNSNEKADIIHSHTIGPYFLLKIWRKNNIIVSAHIIPESIEGSLILSKYWRGFLKLYLKFVYNKADIVLAVSPDVKEYLDNIGLKSKVIYLPNSIDCNKFKKNAKKRNIFRKKYNISEKDFVVCCIGQIQPRKGVEDFCKVACKLKDIKFIWGGTRPFSILTADYLKTNKIMKNAPENVIFTGFVEDINEVYSASDLFFFPSYQENFGLAVLEAASSKLPLVLRDLQVYKSIFGDSYLKGNSIEEFVENIKLLKNDSNLYKQYSEKSILLSEKYHIEKIANQLISIYLGVRHTDCGLRIADCGLPYS